MYVINQVGFPDIQHMWKSPEMWGNDVFDVVSSMKYFDGIVYQGGNDMDVYKWAHSQVEFFAAMKAGFHYGVVSIHNVAADNDEMSLRFRGLCVKPEARGNGLSEQLLHRAIQQGKKRDVQFAWALAGPNSIHVHEKVGFKKVTEQMYDMPDGNKSKHHNCYMRYDF